MVIETFALFYGILGTTAGLKPYFDMLRSKVSLQSTHERIIFKCYRKALKDVLGEDLSRFRLKGNVAILQKIDEYFKGDDQADSDYIGKFLSSLNMNFEDVQKKFERHLSESASPQVLTHISLSIMKHTKEIKRDTQEIKRDTEEIKQVIHEAIGRGKKVSSLEGITTPPTPYFAHPYPLQENFTGRLSERKELTEWFTKGAHPMFAYVAIGGMGKSALTWYWLQEDIVKKGLAPEGIIWWSFYDREARFETFLEKAIKYISKGEIDAKKMDSTRDRMDTLYTLLCNGRFLIVLDGVERVLRAYAGLGSPYQGDEVKKDEKDYRGCIDPNVGTFLQWLASSNVKTKTLLTSRLCPKEMDDIAGCVHKELMELEKEDAVDFFQKQGIKGRRDEIETACKPYGYHPLSLRLLSGMIVKDPQYPCDIVAWAKCNPLPELKGLKKEHHILELAYNSLDEKKRTLISKLSAFRNPMPYDSISIFNDLGTEKKFDDTLIELVDRGLLLRDIKSNRYDLHPIVRKYCYDRLMDKKGVHSQLRDYFASVPKPEKVESLDDLAPVIELYHHTVNSGRYDDACDLFHERISDATYYQFGAYNLRIELLCALFPDGEDKPPRLKREDAQAWTLNALANSYSLSGQPNKAMPLFGISNEIDKKRGEKRGVAIGLGNLADDQMKIGELKSAESNLRRSIDLCRDVETEAGEAVGHQWLGQLLARQGKFEESERELEEARRLAEGIKHTQGQGLIQASRVLRALLMSDAEEALKLAKRAYDIAFSSQNERDKIRAEWLLGAAYLANGHLGEAEKHLTEALVRDRRVNLVELEPDILLELAKLRFKQGHKEESLDLAKEALEIADRCEYRLKQADIHNFLAEFYSDAKEFSQAREHIRIAKQRAECGYVPAMKKAEDLERRIGSTD
ncbi:MAG: tetratricopeptide repeat protein [Candidatus Zixiibacteriota bacterium]